MKVFPDPTVSAGLNIYCVFLVLLIISSVYIAEAAAFEYKISGSAGVNYDSHLVSHGRDVWQTGSDWGSSSGGLLHPWVEGTLTSGDYSVSSGLWMDIHDNSRDSISGEIQEIDFWLSTTYQYKRFQFGASYTNWNYGSDNEQGLEAWVYWNDYDKLIENFGFYPVVKLRTQLDVENYDPASLMLLKMTPGWPLSARQMRPVWLSMPLELGFQEEGFRGQSGGYSFSSAGGLLTIPLLQVPEALGRWNVLAGLTYYSTDKNNNPENPEAEFLTGKLGLIAYF